MNLDRLVDHLRREPETGCWAWTGRSDRRGVPLIWNPSTNGHTRPRQAIVEALYGLSVGRWRVKAACGRAECVAPYHAVLRRPGKVLKELFPGRVWCRNAVVVRLRAYQEERPHERVCWSEDMKAFGIAEGVVAEVARGNGWPRLAVWAAFCQIARTEDYRRKHPKVIGACDER